MNNKYLREPLKQVCAAGGGDKKGYSILKILLQKESGKKNYM